MNIREVTKSLEDLGWKISKDEVGDRIAQYQLSDRKVRIIYGLDRIWGQKHFVSTLGLATEDFSNACLEIYPGYSSDPSFIQAWKGVDIRAPEILEEHVCQASDEAIAWAKEQDLDKAMQDHASLPTDAPGTLPRWHLAALAVLGDVARLKSYQVSFEAGDRLGFVDYVTKDYIDRAVALAEQKASGA